MTQGKWRSDALRELAACAGNFPEQRLCQILVNATQERIATSDPFYVTDEDLASDLRRYRERFGSSSMETV